MTLNGEITDTDLSLKNFQFGTKKGSIAIPVLFSLFSLLEQLSSSILALLFPFKQLMQVLSLLIAGNCDANECITTTEVQQKDFSLTNQRCEYIFLVNLISNTVNMQVSCFTVISIIKSVKILSALIFK